MSKSRIQIIFFLIGLAYISCNNNQSQLRPNIILFVVDDLGWTDLGFMGSLLPILKGENFSRKNIFWHFPAYLERYVGVNPTC